MAVIIGSVTARDTEVDNPTLNLNGVWGVHAVTLAERTFVYAAGAGDSGISGFELGADGSLTNIQNIADDATLELGFVSNFASVIV